MPAHNSIERRVLSMPLTFSSNDDQSEERTVSGYAAMFNSMSEALFGMWVEEIDPTAFDEADMSDVRALFNHNDDKILARTPRTLTLDIDNTGLLYKFSMPNTTYGHDLSESMMRGDVTQSSFGFSVSKDEWVDRSSDGLLPLRRILKISHLYDVSPVTYPAYPETTAEVRSMVPGAKTESPEVAARKYIDYTQAYLNALAEDMLYYKRISAV
jgi:HK97 family phage prohead protease